VRSIVLSLSASPVNNADSGSKSFAKIPGTVQHVALYYITSLLRSPRSLPALQSALASLILPERGRIASPYSWRSDRI